MWQSSDHPWPSMNERGGEVIEVSDGNEAQFQDQRRMPLYVGDFHVTIMRAKEHQQDTWKGGLGGCLVVNGGPNGHKSPVGWNS